jgi:hypothetical protein
MTKTEQAKERLRQHLTHLNRIGWIDQYQIVRDKVYYYKEVMSALKLLGITNDSGHKLKDFDTEAFIHALHETKIKQARQIAPRKAKAIGQKMYKDRNDLANKLYEAVRKLPIVIKHPEPSYKTLPDIIDENKQPIKAFGLESEKQSNEIEREMFEANQELLANFTDQELKDELTSRGWHGELMKVME